MLPTSVRLRKSQEISKTLKSGKRYPAKFLVFHIAKGQTPETRFAFAVGKSVGNSVIRHRLTRRLRHICAQNISTLPAGSDVVVRALPGSGSAEFSDLEKSFTAAAGKAGN